jgi:hypothetical protein
MIISLIYLSKNIPPGSKYLQTGGWRWGQTPLWLIASTAKMWRPDERQLSGAVFAGRAVHGNQTNRPTAPRATPMPGADAAIRRAPCSRG